MPEKIRYKINPVSHAPFVSSMISLFAAVMLCVMYWPIFVQYFSDGTYGTTAVSTAIVVFYSILILGLLFYSLFTGILAKRTLSLAALFSLPVVLFYLLDIVGMRNTVLFFDIDNVFWFYRNSAGYFRAAWPFVVIVALLTVAGALSFVSLAFSKAKSPAAAAMFVGVSAVGWLAFSIYHVAAFDSADYIAGLLTARDFVYTIMSYTAATFFFSSQFIVALAVKKATADDIKPAAEYAAPPVPMMYPVSPVSMPQPAPAAFSPLVAAEDDAVIIEAAQTIAPEYSNYSHDASALPDHLSDRVEASNEDTIEDSVVIAINQTELDCAKIPEAALPVGDDITADLEAFSEPQQARDASAAKKSPAKKPAKKTAVAKTASAKKTAKPAAAKETPSDNKPQENSAN